MKTNHPRYHWMANVAPFLTRDTGVEPDDLRGIQFHLTQKANQRYPHLLEMVKIGPQVWDRKNKAEVDAMHAAIIARVHRIAPRLARRRAYIAKRNEAILKEMTQDQAIAALVTDRGSRALAWFESLPLGITRQAASDATGYSFTVSWWEHRVLRSESYTPGGKMRRTRQVAKRI